MTTTINASNSGSGGLIQTADASGVLALQTAGTTAVTINASQNVGIGTTSPSSKFHVAGGSGSTIRNTASAGSSWFVGSNVDSYILHNESNTPMLFTTNGTEQARIDSSGNFKFNSGYGSVATAYGCRAWVNFNGTGTVAIRASGNVSSITDNGTGDYTLNFTTAMPDANYSPNVNLSLTFGGGLPYGVFLFSKTGTNFTPTTTAFSFTTWTSTAGAQIDPLYVLASVFR